MSRPSLYTRSKTAPQLPPLSSISPISLPFTDRFSPISKTPHHVPQNQHHDYYHHQRQNVTHPFTRSTSCLPSPPLQKHLPCPLRRASFASLATKSLPYLPLPTLRPAHILQRLRSSFSSFLTTKREEHDHEQENELEQNEREIEHEEDTWGREWERGYEERKGDDGGDCGWEREEGEFGRDFCLHLPPEVSMDRSEIEYLRRLEREALSARVVGVTS